MTNINTLEYIICGISDSISFDTQSNIIDLSKLYEEIHKFRIFSSLSFEEFLPIAISVLKRHNFAFFPSSMNDM